MHLGKKDTFLPLGTTPKTRVSLIAKKITAFTWEKAKTMDILETVAA